MARQNYNVNSGEKKIEVYASFAGGAVTQAHPEKLTDDQFQVMENTDIVAGGVAQVRGGYQQTNSPSVAITGNTQGRFRYENLAGGQDIVAINGKLYTVSGNTYTNIPIPGLVSFQASRPIEAVQDRTKMYFATGSGVVIYDGVSASLMTAYKPNGLEALYVGTNGYAQDPLNYLSDTTGAANAILGITSSMRYGIINQLVTFTAYIQQVVGDVLEYKWESKQVSSVDYKTDKDWSTTKSLGYSFTVKNDYMIRVSLRKQGTTAILSQYVIPRFKVNTVPDEKPEPDVNFDEMKLCNRIFIHYDRLYLYGDTVFPDNLYVSQLNNFTYFPRTFITKITDPLRGSLQTVVRYRSFLVAFTDNSIQAIHGKEPREFEKAPVHTTLGTKHPYSVKIMKNYIAFVGNDYGVYYLKSFNYASDDKLNVERIDEKVKDVVVGLIKAATNVFATIYNEQYYLYIESGGSRYFYRFYYEYGVWVRDVIGFSINSLVTLDNVLYCTSTTGGTMYKLNPAVFKDGTNTTYYVRLTSKNYQFGQPHHRKKLKMFQLITRIGASTTISTKLYADDKLLSTTSLVSDATQTGADAQKLTIMQSGRFRYVHFEIEITVTEFVQLVGFGFIFKENTPK